MLNTPILDVAIGLVFTYTVLAIFCSAASEAVAQGFNLRSQVLWQAIRTLLGDPNGTGLAASLYNHPLVAGLTTRSKGKAPANIHDSPKPAYISPAVFSDALMDVLGNGEKDPNKIVSAAATHLNSGNVNAAAKSALLPLLDSAGSNVSLAQNNVQAWFNQAMDRASGRYQQTSRLVIFYIAFLLSFGLNADTVMMVRQLWANPSQRQALVTAASQITKTPTGGATADVKTLPQTQPGQAPLALLDTTATQALFGWTGSWSRTDPTYDLSDMHAYPRSGFAWIAKLFGLLLTSLAASLGAPFWFGVLNRLTNVRANGPAPGSKAAAASTGEH